MTRVSLDGTGAIASPAAPAVTRVHPCAGGGGLFLGPVAALFVRADSIYKTMPGVDAWDIERDARKWPGGCPVVAHPPCRAWGRLRQFAKPRPDEKDLAPWAVEKVRRWGGVLEHPANSSLWIACGL